METVEDEYHFIFDCQCYETERNNSNIILKNMLKMELTPESKQNLLEHIMSSSDQVLVNLFSKHLSDCFTKRTNALNLQHLCDHLEINTCKYFARQDSMRVHNRFFGMRELVYFSIGKRDIKQI